MGMEILKTSLVYGRRLSGNAYKVLVTMSVTALDKPKDGHPAGLYYGGWGALAIALGYPEASANDRNSAGHKAVKRAIKELRDGSYITPMIVANKGSRQSYSVHPGGHSKGDQNDPTEGDHFDPVKGDQNGPQRGTKMVPPRTTKDDHEDLPQDISINSATELQTARGSEKPDVIGHKFEGKSRDDPCEVCGRTYLNRPAHPLHLILRGA